MSDYATARAIRDASRALVLAIAMCSAFVVVVLPITTTAVVYTAAKWKAEAWASQMEGASEDWERGWDEGREQSRERAQPAK